MPGIWDDLNDAITSIFAETELVEHENGSFLAISVRAYDEVGRVVKRTRVWSAKTAELPSMHQGDMLSMGLEEWKIMDIQPDDGGMTEILVERG